MGKLSSYLEENELNVFLNHSDAINTNWTVIKNYIVHSNQMTHKQTTQLLMALHHSLNRVICNSCLA